MTFPIRPAIGGLAFMLCLDAAAARAEGPSPDAWQFDMAGYAWTIGIEGDVTARGRKTSVNASFIDVVEDSDSLIGLMGRFGGQKGDWGFFIDGVYTRIGVEEGIRNTESRVKATSEIFMLEGVVTYRLGTWRFGQGDAAPAESSRLALDVYGGARYTYLNLELKFEDRRAERSADKSRDWVDPIIGARVLVDIGSRWQLLAGADIGGFGVGSDFTWQALGLVGYSFNGLGIAWTATAGYRAIYQDYKHGSGSSAFEWDVTMHGPVIGLVGRF